MKTALVTGGTKGIGFVTAKKLAQRGFRVVITGRSQSTCDEAAKKIAAEVPGATAVGMALDLSSLEAVRAFAKAFDSPLDLLVNNAGNMSLDKTAVVTTDGIEVTLATMMFYKNSKLALMWLTYELDRRLAGTGVVVNAVCPGFVPETVAEHAKGIRYFLFKHVMTHMPGAHTAEEAADNTLFAATDAAYETKAAPSSASKKRSSPRTKRTTPQKPRASGSSPAQ